MKAARQRLLGLAGYVIAALGLSWPLPLHLGTMLPGPIGGDTGVYVWNLWLFRHEILVHHRLPYFTTEILSLTAPADLSLHNYTVFDDLLAFPLLPLTGPVAAYNLVFLIATVLAASAMFFLALRICRSAPAAWLAGLLFAWSPALVARGEAHLSLVNAAALPAFVVVFDRWWRSGRAADACLAGLVVAWAVMSDPYYGVYCVILAVALLAARCLQVSRRPPRPERRWSTAVLAVAILAVSSLIVAILVTGGFEFRFLGVRVQAFTLYTPVLVLTVLCTGMAALILRPRVHVVRALDVHRVSVAFASAAIGCALPLLPFFIALGARMSDGGRFHAPILWRSSPRGVDLLSLVSPNPNSALFRGWLRPWFERQPGGFSENVASLTLVGIVSIAFVMWRYRFRPSRSWLSLTVLFALLALGPFVYVAGVNTFIPGPWAFLRYVPLAASARMPARFAAPMMMALAIVFAESVACIARRHATRQIIIFSAIGAALVVELAPVPRPLYDARVPSIYKIIAEDPRPIRIMELPLGFRDGEFSYGNFTAASQFFQTYHEKRLIGGYLSRISRRELERQFRFPVVRTITSLSEGGSPTARQREILLAAGRRFAARARLGYVVIDRHRAPAPLCDLAIEAFGLVKIAEDGPYELYRVPLGQLALGAEDPLLQMPAIEPIDRN
ncbi:MAG TPA: hypothetical protein VL262_15865 [Vicinamibacterales bacterium]|nr:hypothetical protein [Vicinamibacterales bacterium]